MKKSHVVILIVLIVLLIDQSLKIWIKTTMTLGEEIYPFGVENDWCRLHFTENKGMAFGMTLGGEYGKLALSLFRIFAVAFMGYYTHMLIKQKAHKGLVYSIALIMAGAIGNIIDSAVYGMIFSASHFHQVAEMFPENGGYAPFLYGKVVDMFYFPMVNTTFPDWLPWLGGKPFQFFRPVFNVADSAISIGVFFIILFQKTYFNSLDNPQGEQSEELMEETTEEEESTDDSNQDIA